MIHHHKDYFFYLKVTIDRVIYNYIPVQIPRFSSEIKTGISPSEIETFTSMHHVIWTKSQSKISLDRPKIKKIKSFLNVLLA